MKSLFSKEVLAHPLVLGAVAVVALIAAASGFYYISVTRAPQASSLPSDTSSTTAITASGSVEPAENPNLGFEVGGRVARVSAAVGQVVGKGQLLASLDTSILSAERAAAAATLKGAEAKLSEMQAGPRTVDVSAKQTAVSQAESSLGSLYASTPASIAQAYDKSFSGISAYTDTLFNQPYSINPSLDFSTSDSQLAAAAATARTSANSALTLWQKEQTSLPGAAPEQLDPALDAALQHLSVLRDYSNALLGALGNAIPAGSFTQTSLTAAQTAVGTYRDSINTQIAAMLTVKQQLSGAKLAVQSASDALNQVLAGSTPQAIEGQQAAVDAAAATVANFDAQISQAIIVAPFSGTVGSVQIKVGDTVTPNTVAVTLNPQSALQVTAYVSESDAGQVAAGQSADVTLDAYGSSRSFPATVVSVDRSPTMQSGVPAYKVVLQFAQNDPAISSGMTANVTIQK